MILTKRKLRLKIIIKCCGIGDVSFLRLYQGGICMKYFVEAVKFFSHVFIKVLCFPYL